MGNCCHNNTWATTVLDGLPATVGCSAACTPCPQSTSWAEAVLDALPDCQHSSHGVTALTLSSTVGSELLIAKEDVSAVDCGYLGVGSLIFSSSNVGASATIVRLECDEVTYAVVVVSQPLPVAPAIIQQFTQAVEAGSSYSLVAANTATHNLHAPMLLAPEGSEANYAITSVEIVATGFKVFYNATIMSAGYVLCYSLMAKG